MNTFTIIFNDAFAVATDARMYAGNVSSLGDNEYVCTQGQYERFGAQIRRNGALIDIGYQPSPAYDLDINGGLWVLNEAKQAALDEAAYKASIPESVSMVQAQLALLQHGYLDAVEAYMQSEHASREAQIFWRGTTVRRDDETVKLMLWMLGLTDKQGDELFKLAASL